MEHETPPDRETKPESGRTGRATVRDVAARAGVSIGTVSRVMTGNTPVSDELIALVSAAAAELGFKPRKRSGPAARARMRLIPFFLTDVANLLFGHVVNAAEERLAQFGYTLVVVNTHNSVRREQELLGLLADPSVVGAILSFGEESHPGLGKALRGLGSSPVVMLDRTPPKGIDSVLVDHRGGAFDACSHLIGLGHRRIAMITAAGHIRPGMERIAGYRQAHERAGLPVDMRLVRADSITADAAFTETEQLLRLAERPTAIVTPGSQALGGTLRAINASGLRIPDDISLICFGDTEMAKVVQPTVTCVQWDRWQLGRQAADLLMDRMAGLSSGVRSIVLPTEVILRGSCAPPRRAEADAD